MISVENKFEIGQEVYYIRKTRVSYKCPVRDGMGYKIFNDYKFSCPACNGRGIRQSNKKIYMAHEKDMIDRIKIFRYLENGELKTVVKYKLKNGDEFVESSLFTTKEESEQRCKELNELNEKL